MLPSGHTTGCSPHSGGGSLTSQFIGWQLGGIPVWPSGHTSGIQSGGVPVVPSGHIHSSTGTLGSFGSHGGGGGGGDGGDGSTHVPLTSLEFPGHSRLSSIVI